MRFEFATATRIVFGWGVRDQLGALAAGLGRRALVVTGANQQRASALVENLERQSVKCSLLPIAGEPTVAQARAGAQAARDRSCDIVVAIGGGGALDAGKAIAALASNGGDPLDYLEVVGRGRPIEREPLAFVAVPTTAGTGSEVTRNAVLLSPDHGIKASMRSDKMLPRLALVDPQLCCSMPSHVTAATGLDALTQLIEPYVCNRANPLVDALCREGMMRIAQSLRAACERPDDSQARTDMSVASLMGGMALANAGLGAAHGFAAVLGGMLRASHGALCARLIGPVITANAKALRERAPQSAALERYDEVGRILSGDGDAGAADAVVWIEQTCEQCGVPDAASWGLQADQVDDVVVKAASASSMRANPIALEQSECKAILLSAMHPRARTGI